MDKRLIIQTIVRPDCKLIAIDNSDYYSLGDDMINFIMLDFLSYNETEIPIDKTIRMRREVVKRGQLLSRFSSEFILDKDGTYCYYKLVIPTLDYFKIGETTYNNLSNELFFDGKTLYKCKFEDDDEHSYEEVIKNSIVIDNYIDAYKIVHNNGASQTFYCPVKKIFSVCKLQRCLVYLQRQLLLINCKHCSYDKCDTDNTLRNRRDFLLSAMYVFDYLKDIGNLTEAQRVLDSMSSCDSLCGDLLNNSNNDCGCGNSI